MGLFQRNGKWGIDYYCQGRRVRKVVGTKAEAKRLLAIRQGEIAEGRLRLPARSVLVSLGRFLEEYLAYSESYKSSHDRDLIFAKHFIAFFGDVKLSEITPLFIEKFKQARIKDVKRATVNRELSALRHMFNMAIRWDMIKENPTDKVDFYKEEETPLRFLSESEMAALIHACSDWLRPIVICALQTGMRMREILDLEWRNVDMARRIITVEKTKSKRFRRVKIHDQLYGVLEGLEQRCRYVFPNSQGKPFMNIHKGFYAAIRRAGIDHVRFHDLRHTFASHLIMRGESLVTLKEILGHKDIAMTMRYAHLSDRHLREAVDKFPVIDLKNGHRMVTELGLVRGGKS